MSWKKLETTWGMYICDKCGKGVTTIWAPEEEDKPDDPWLCEECYEERDGE